MKNIYVTGVGWALLDYASAAKGLAEALRELRGLLTSTPSLDKPTLLRTLGLVEDVILDVQACLDPDVEIGRRLREHGLCWLAGLYEEASRHVGEARALLESVEDVLASRGGWPTKDHMWAEHHLHRALELCRRLVVDLERQPTTPSRLAVEELVELAARLHAEAYMAWLHLLPVESKGLGPGEDTRILLEELAGVARGALRLAEERGVADVQVLRPGSVSIRRVLEELSLTRRAPS